MENRRKIKYSIIRYSPDDIKGEVLNVGVILHDYKKAETKFNILSENSSKLKSILESKTDFSIYKSYKDILEYYLNNINNDLSGTVGEKTIASHYSEEFLLEMYEHHKNKKLFFSEPSFAMTKDVDKFFQSIFSRYVRNEVEHKVTTISAKEHLKQKFEELNLIGSKIKADCKISPIQKLSDYKVKVDFTFKNGKWNYIQTIPKNGNINMDWYSKLQVMAQWLNKDETKIHLVYSESDINNDKTIRTLIDYLSKENKNIGKLNIDNKSSIDELCKYINEVGEVLENKVG